jgi:hypothetical protein
MSDNSPGPKKYWAEKVNNTKCYLFHSEGFIQTLIAITGDLEKAHFLAAAANKFSLEDEAKPETTYKQPYQDINLIFTRDRIERLEKENEGLKKLVDERNGAVSRITEQSMNRAREIEQLKTQILDCELKLPDPGWSTEISRLKHIIQDQQQQISDLRQEVFPLEKKRGLDNYEGFREDLKHDKGLFKEMKDAISFAMWDVINKRDAIPNRDFCIQCAEHFLHLLIWEKARGELSKAIEVIRTELNENKDYFTTWIANIAIAFQDEYCSQLSVDSDFRKKLHGISCKAAERFLNNFITKK